MEMDRNPINSRKLLFSYESLGTASHLTQRNSALSKLRKKMERQERDLEIMQTVIRSMKSSLFGEISDRLFKNSKQMLKPSCNYSYCGL